MFESLSERLSQTFRNLTGRGRLTPENIQSSLEEVRMALLDADVGLAVVEHFINSVKEKAIGLEVNKEFSPDQVFIKLVHQELIQLMGEKNEALNLKSQKPAVILMAGLQGSGKTTTAAKLARLLINNFNKSVMLVSCDIYRPAAIWQLKTLSDSVKANFFESHAEQNPADIAKTAYQAALQKGMDVLIVDTAGRLHLDDALMQEIKGLHSILNPIETLFVVDSMTGQDAVKTAKAFNDSLDLTGVILSKIDGDARGGAALSIRQVTGKPIKFLGTGEKTEALEAFYPDRLASRILGMGDVLSLIENIEQTVDKKEAEKLAKKLHKGQGFDLNDLKSQLMQMMNMGGLSALMGKLPGMGAIPQAAKDKINDQMLVKMIAVIDSMTKDERRFPAKIVGSRKKRIADGSGNPIQTVNQVLKQHMQMQKMMKKLKGMKGITNMMRGMQGKLPSDLFRG
ncbi:MAG: signal recognition particle [Francisellaceae bacterium]|nr:signal recognition particle [Francisellaceae bacterium]